MKLPSHVVLDAGKTQVARGSATVLAILGIQHTSSDNSSGPEDVVNSVTGHLKLL